MGSQSLSFNLEFLLLEIEVMSHGRGKVGGKGAPSPQTLGLHPPLSLTLILLASVLTRAPAPLLNSWVSFFSVWGVGWGGKGGRPQGYQRGVWRIPQEWMQGPVQRLWLWRWTVPSLFLPPQGSAPFLAQSWFAERTVPCQGMESHVPPVHRLV